MRILLSRIRGRVVGAALGAAALSFCAPLGLGAQDMRRELVLGGPTAIGVLFPISERWSVRADGSVAGTVNGVGGGAGVGPSSSWNITVGASALRHVPGDGPVRSYLVGRVGYQRTMPKGGTVSHTYTYSAGIGVSARIADQFALFTEFTAQAAYATSTVGGNKPYVTSWGTVTRIGATIRRKAP